MKRLLVLILWLSAAHSHAAPPSPAKQGSLHQLLQRQLPRGRATLSSILAAGSLLLTSPAAAQNAEILPPLEQQQDNHIEHYAVLNLVLTFAGTVRDSHIVYIGEDRQARALFLSLRFNLLALPVAEAELLLGTAAAQLFDHTGLVLHDAEVEEVQNFLRPDAELARLHDIALLVVEGVDTRAYQAVQIDTFPAPGTSLTTVAYRTDLVPERKARRWLEVIAAAPLAREKCRAFNFMPELWLAHSNCGLHDRGSTTSAPIFTAEDKLVGFHLIEGDIVVVPPQVHAYLEEALVVAAEQKLPLTWGAIKKGGY